MASLILAELLEYDPKSVTGLRWKSRSSGFQGGFNKAGKAAGFRMVNPDGYQYWRVTVNGSPLPAHRIVWELVSGEPIPAGLQVDHIDGNALNNRVENMRLVVPELNARNQKMPRTNRTGVTGVSYNRHYDSYVARCSLPSGRVSKTFTVGVLGAEAAFEQACRWRKQMLDSANSQGAGFTNRHGT
ncbi:HNH endonuclease [Achromobacter xylosoxidans]|uniref:HNH endonuclease n=1 Tax=Alcaligenes xylosoxydans xylosoxydans TaxID=85698 RepID=UPI00244819AC|nr:HNH endonuclease [Achromobacter xylosoxidans]MDH0520871.1 HNH endonuclease [Achromobacter xylosoxidans]MDH0544843.1 HNH endonuclease [Achromobacter xylosoxidans]